MVRILFLLVGQVISTIAFATDATILLAKTEIEIEGANKARVSEYRKIKIHNSEGRKFSIVQDYYDKSKRVRGIELTIYDANGRKVRKFNKSSAFDISISESYEIQDTRILILDPDYQNYPFTVEYEVISNYNGFVGFPTWVPRYDYELEVKRAELTLKTQEEFEIRSRDYLLESPLQLSTEGFNVNKWSITDLQAIGRDVDRDVFYENQPKVLISPIDFKYDGSEGTLSSWEAFGDWFYDLNEGGKELSPTTLAFLDQLTTLESHEAIFQVYKYMQDRTRYISIQLGIGGFKAFPAKEVDETGYGDCKALTNYMMSMLNYLKIPSNYILVQAGIDEIDVEKDFPSFQFNHVFLGVPMENDTIFLECTNQTIPFNYIGSFTDDRNVLWVEKGGSKIIRTPEYDENINALTTSASFKLTKNGDITGDIQFSNKGYFFDRYDIYRELNPIQTNEYNYGLFSLKDFTIDNFVIRDPADQSPEFISEFMITANNVAKNVSSRIIMPVCIMNPIDKFVTVNKYTEYGEVERSITINDKLSIAFPEGYYFPNPPENIMFEEELGSYQLSIERKGHVLHINRKIVLKKGRYQKKDFELFNAFVKKIKSSDSVKVLGEVET